MKLSLELTEKELNELNGNRENLKTLLISRVLYNESLDFEFSKGQEKEMWFLSENEIIKLYLDQNVEKRVTVLENDIIDEYNKNKEYFKEKNINFEDARNIIRGRLEEQSNFLLSENLVKNLVDEMTEDVTLSKEDLKFSHGDPGIIKLLIIIQLANKKAKETDFFEKNKEVIEVIKNNIRVNYYINLFVKANLNITEEELEKIYQDEKEKLNTLSKEEAMQVIFNQLATLKSDLIKREIANNAYSKYNLEEIVVKYLGSDENK